MRAVITFHSIDDSGTVLPYPPALFADLLVALHESDLPAVGVLFEAHTSSHPDLRKLQLEEIAAECAAADEIIEQRLGRRPQYFATPTVTAMSAHSVS